VPDAKKRPSASQLLTSVEEAMTRSCGVCGTSLSIGKGLECTGTGHHFRCWSCHAESNDCLMNGDIVCKFCNGGVFLFSMLRPHLTELQFARWNNAMMAIQKRELENKHQIELAGLRNASELDRLVEHIRLCLLFNACPRCHSRFKYTGGCMALACPDCKCNFCGHCFKDCGDDAHKHATNCEYNKNKGKVHLVGEDEKKSFELVSLERRRRELRLYLQLIVDIELRGRVEQVLLNDKDEAIRDSFKKMML
jgi:hypothetical protein